jgi:hypothetical protein
MAERRESARLLHRRQPGGRMRTDLVKAVLLATCVAGVAGACNSGNGTKMPEKQTQSAVQPRNDAVTVSGCLRAGEAENTFVLNAAKTQGAMETATYQLMGAETDRLRQHVGEQVEVSGMLRSEQEVASVGTTLHEKPAKGTSGTPMVKTKSEVDVKSLVVESVKPTGQKCVE